MNTLLLQLNSFSNYGNLFLPMLALWATAVLGSAWAVTYGVKRASPTVTYCIWQFATVGLLFLPILCLVLPGIPLGIAIASPTSEPSSFDRLPVVPTAIGPNRSTNHDRRAETTALTDVPTQFGMQSQFGPDSRSTDLHNTDLSSNPSLNLTQPRVQTESSAAIPTLPAHISWSALLFGVWAFGVLIQVALIAKCHISVHRLMRRACTISGQRMEASRHSLRCNSTHCDDVAILESRETQIPFVVGIFRPRILLPDDAQHWPVERLRMVLSHELAHVERRDVLWQLIARAIAAVYWFHPLMWLSLRKMCEERERACDDQVLLGGVAPVDYAAGLVEVAAALKRRQPNLVGGIGMAQQGRLEGRVRAILDKTSSRTPASIRLRRLILLGTAFVVLSLSLLRPFSPKSGAAENPPADKPSSTGSEPATTPDSSKPLKVQVAPDKAADNKSVESKPTPEKPIFDDEGNQPTKGHILVRVVDSKGEPLAGVSIHASVWTHEKDFKANRDYETDAKGQVEVQLPSTLYILRLWANKHGYVNGFKGWENNPAAKRKPVPEEFTVRLQTGTVLGGIVVDEDGQPVPGAEVQVRSEPGGSLADGNDLKTDAQGRWKLENVPAGDNREVRVVATHPNFISLHSYYDMGLEKPLPIAELRAQTAKVVMQRGVRVSGTITDPNGKPVVGALAIWGDRPYWEHRPQQEVRTDSDGIYHLPPLPAGPMRVTIVAPNWMPETRQIEVAKGMAPLDIQLKPGKTLRIRIVDINGLPVSKASFNVSNWRGAESLYNEDHPNVLDSKIPRDPDENGIYEWTWAPDDAVRFRVSAIGDFCVSEVDFTADDQEHVFILMPVLRIAGKVSDAETGKPIEKFTIIPVEELAPGLAVTNRNHSLQRSAGQYVTDHLDRTDVDYRVRIEAEGYRSAVGKKFHVGDLNPTADFSLERAPAASGRVLDPDGKPVKGAKVYLATKMQDLSEPQLKEDSSSNNFRVDTNLHGEFSFPAQCERYLVMVMSDAGYAEVDLPSDQIPGDLKLKNWARVDGQLMQAGKPVANANIMLSPLRPRFGDWPYIEDQLFGQTDENGHFNFPKVPPVKCYIAADLSPWEKYPITSSQRVPLDLQSDQHVTLNLGGEGAQVTGLVKLKGEHASDFDLNWSLNYLLRRTPGIETPANFPAKDFDWRFGWSDAWTGSQEGLAYLETLNTYFVRLSSDGTLLVSGVPAGEYELALKVYEHKDPTACMVNPVASKIVRFKVTDADVAKAAVDLGTIEVDAALGPEPGDAVSDFELEMLDGTTKKLSKFRGQYVLLDFWATWCNSCVASLPEMRKLYGKYGNSGQLAVLSLSMDADIPTAREFIKQHNLPWEQGFLDKGSESKTLVRFGISSVPTYVLIDPDGKLIQKCHSIDEVNHKLAALNPKK